MALKPRKEKGDMKSMVFEDFLDSFGGGRRERRSPDTVMVSRSQYQSLLAKLEKYEALGKRHEALMRKHEALVEEHKRVKTANDRLMKELDDLKDDARKFKVLEEEKEKFLRQLLQVRADFENHKKREERENSKYRQYVMEGLLRKLLSHYDDLIRALNLLKMLEGVDGIRKGFEIVVRNFEKVMEEEGIRPMESEGKKFDPYKHEAMMVEEGRDDLPENTIVEVLDKGYYLKDKVLRPAKVRISKQSRPLVEAGQSTESTLTESKSTESKSTESKLQESTKKLEVN